MLACSSPNSEYSIAEGIPLTVAQNRTANITDLSYQVRLEIPAQLSERITGESTIEFNWKGTDMPLIIDFRTQASDVLEVTANDEGAITHVWSNGHIIIPSQHLRKGKNTVSVSYLAGNSSLNRNEEYLYTLFVPDRASYALPIFDQPDLKATYDVTLTVPDGWTAVGNGPLQSNGADPGDGVYRFASQHPISTYLFSFAAGVFQSETTTIEGREMTMYHRESDTTKVANNIDDIFELHYQALEWLEDYTAIDYPFEKFDFVLIPSFQYGGMEHPGAILYRARSLFLEPSATPVEQLRRASLIAHETAHMWFGDLVTMEWFNDVWMKEVFANFMAAKIVNPAFPEVNHDLRFFLAHYPSAYAVDRTAGAHPIRQQLDNLKDAGTLYGNIIYQKAPIVMRQLELILGEDQFRDGLRTYLSNHAYGNATWPDLIAVLDELSEEDLAQWSQVWVQEGGRPTVMTESIEASGEAKLRFSQSDEQGDPKTWNQFIKPAVWRANGDFQQYDVQLATAKSEISIDFEPAIVLPNSAGLGYGYFQLSEETIDYLLEHLHEIEDPLVRAVALVDLWEEMLYGRVAPGRVMEMLRTAMPVESDDQISQRMLGYIETCFWQYHPQYQWEQLAIDLEPLLWDLANNPNRPKLQLAYFRTLSGIAMTEGTLNRLEAILRNEASIEGLTIGENDKTRLAFELALREHNEEQVLAYQHEQIKSQDRKDRFDFITPALASDASLRKEFFESLRLEENRSHEPWVLNALGYLHHPLRADQAVQFIEPSLQLMEEIQVTGDIFFPTGWIRTTLGGHQSAEAADVVRRFLSDRPDYPQPLRLKILQAADPLERASGILRSGETE